MQGYMYSIFSGAALVIHLIINFDLLAGRGVVTKYDARYRGFVTGVLAYYVTDAVWGILAGLGWKWLWYADTVLFFLALVAFVLMWGRFVILYLDLGKQAERILSWSGYALLAANVIALAANPFTDCFFHIDAQGVYRIGYLRDPAFYLLIAFIVLTAFFVFRKAIGDRDSVRRRGMMVFQCCITMAVAMVLQIILPLTPFTALGCLICICFFHVFVLQDKQAVKHMRELEKALERARMAERAKSMFFSVVSHDIRTPLNAILGYAELLQSDIQSPAERDEALQSIRASGTTLLQLVNDVLDLAKIDSGTMTLHPEPVRLAKLTDEVFASFRLAASDKGVELVNKTISVPTVMLDEHRVRQILFNLVGNAVKFTEKGSVTVSASFTGTVGAKFSGTVLEVAVSDTGCGIPKEMLTRILDPFVQVQDPSHSADRAGGTGLGLSICRRLIEAMGGELLVESEVGKGSTFRARFPGVSAGVRKAAAEVSDAPDELPRHVLVVDDSPVNRTVLTAFLKKAGIVAVDTASDGGTALSALDLAVKNGTPFDFVFSDLWMPNMSGTEFVGRLREDPRFGTLPVFAVTADTEFRNDARGGLFTGVLLKPVTYEKLIKAFSTAAAAR